MSEPIHVLAILRPAPGKISRVEELLKNIALWIKANEDGTLEYQVHSETRGDKPAVAVVEKYKDRQALRAHGDSAQFKEMNRIFQRESLLSGPMKVYIMKPVTGFASRL